MQGSTGALGRVFCFAYVWSIGGVLESSCWPAFDAFAREQLREVAAYPSEGLVFDFFLDPKRSVTRAASPRTDAHTCTSMATVQNCVGW
jgi:Dynein heavy chain AAA lid domain